jgi:hypothetical protein
MIYGCQHAIYVILFGTDFCTIIYIILKNFL